MTDLLSLLAALFVILFGCGFIIVSYLFYLVIQRLTAIAELLDALGDMTGDKLLEIKNLVSKPISD